MINNMNKKLVNRFLDIMIDSCEPSRYWMDTALNGILTYNPDEYDTMLIIAHQIETNANRYKDIENKFCNNPEMYVRYIKENYTFEEYVRDEYPNEYEDIMDIHSLFYCIHSIVYEKYAGEDVPYEEYKIIPHIPINAYELIHAYEVEHTKYPDCPDEELL